MKNYLILFICCCSFSTLQSQNLNDLRQMTMQSDVILAGNTSIKLSYYNDYVKRLVFTVTKLHKMVYNAGGFDTGDSVKVFQPFSDYAIFWDDRVVFVDDLDPVKESEKAYTNLHFIRRETGLSNFVSVGSINNVEWKDFTTRYLPLINELRSISGITDLEERYGKTIDWYIEWGGYPDNDFLAFYKEKGVIEDTLTLTEKQLLKAKKLFLEGSEELLPFVRNSFCVEVRSYYLQKMKKIRKIKNPEWTDLWEFRNAVDNVLPSSYSSIDYYLKWQISKDHTDDYDRNRLMDYFIGKLDQLINEAAGIPSMIPEKPE